VNRGELLFSGHCRVRAQVCALEKDNRVQDGCLLVNMNQKLVGGPL